MANSAANAQQVKDALFKSVSCGDVEKTKTILQSNSGVDINKTVVSKGRSLLHLACEHGHINMVRWLVSLGADVNMSGYYYRKFTPLSLAVLNNHPSIVSALVSEFGCDPNDRESLHTACKHGDLSMVKTLIECGASMYSTGDTPLHVTARNQRKEITQELLKYFTGDPNIKNAEGRTPLHIACVYGNLDRVKLLILQGAEMNVKDIYFDTPLSLAIVNNHTSIVSALVREFGCDPNDGVSLHTACKHGDPSMVKTLIECSASVDDKDVGGKTPLSLAVLDNQTSIVSALVSEFGCDPNDGVSLHTACKHGDLSIVKTLIECGANVNEKDVGGNTPLSLAVLHGHDSIVSALVSEFGCDPNDGAFIHTACEHGNLSMVKTLIECGANVNEKDVGGNTPLSLHGHDSIVSALVSKFGCDPNDGVSLHTACKHGNLSMVNTLIECGASVMLMVTHSYI